jgi:antitoxin HigA-1
MTDTTPKHPGKILFDQVMTPLGVSRNKLARDIDVPVGRISDIVAGKRGVTPDTALRFAKYFGTTAELWLRLQADYDLYIARTTTWQESEPRVAEFQPVPDAGAAPQYAAVPDTDIYPRGVSRQEVVGSGTAENVMPIREGVQRPETSGEAPAHRPADDHDDEMAADPSTGKIANPLSTVGSDDEDIDIPEPVTAGMRRPEAG